MKRKKTALSLYSSKVRRKRKKTDTTRRIGRPPILRFPRPTKDLDSTIEYEDEPMSDDSYYTDHADEEEDDDEALSDETYGSVSSFQFQHTSNGDFQQLGKNMAGHPSSSPDPSSSPSLSDSDPAPPSSSSSSDSSDLDDDILRRPYISYCCRELRNVEFVRNLVRKLYTSCCLQNFMLLEKQIANGDLSPLNITFLLCLEHAKWQSLKSTILMKYRDVTKTF